MSKPWLTMDVSATQYCWKLSFFASNSAVSSLIFITMSTCVSWNEAKTDELIKSMSKFYVYEFIEQSPDFQPFKWKVQWQTTEINDEENSKYTYRITDVYNIYFSQASNRRAIVNEWRSSDMKGHRRWHT